MGIIVKRVRHDPICSGVQRYAKKSLLALGLELIRPFERVLNASVRLRCGQQVHPDAMRLDAIRIEASVRSCNGEQECAAVLHIQLVVRVQPPRGLVVMSSGCVIFPSPSQPDAVEERRKPAPRRVHEVPTNVFEQHPECAIVTIAVVTSVGNEALVDIRVLVPFATPVGPRAVPLVVPPRVAQAHERPSAAPFQRRSAAGVEERIRVVADQPPRLDFTRGQVDLFLPRAADRHRSSAQPGPQHILRQLEELWPFVRPHAVAYPTGHIAHRLCGVPGGARMLRPGVDSLVAPVELGKGFLQE